jgi:hypothetical protein
MSRPLTRQPDLPILWRSGEGSDKAECISYNVCLPIGIARMTCRAKMQQYNIKHNAPNDSFL